MIEKAQPENWATYTSAGDAAAGTPNDMGLTRLANVSRAEQGKLVSLVS